MKLAHFFCVAASVCLCVAAEPKGVPVAGLGKEFDLIGKVGVPLGKLVTIEGILIDGPFKGYEGGPTLQVQRIAGKYTQEDIQIPISPYPLEKWGEKVYKDDKVSLPKLEKGKTYQMEGYETGSYVGIPSEAYTRANLMLQTTGHYFHSDFVVIVGKRIDPIVAAPGIFEDKPGLLEGTARTENGNRVMAGSTWKVIVARGEAWPADVEGKAVETLGLYLPATEAKQFELFKGEWRLARLEDQVGKKVSLHGSPWSMNGDWCFDYRGHDILVDGMENLPGWRTDLHGEPIVIEGTLERVKELSPEKLDFIKTRSLKVEFVVREPSWKPAAPLLTPEMPPPPPPEKEEAAPGKKEKQPAKGKPQPAKRK